MWSPLKERRDEEVASTRWQGFSQEHVQHDSQNTTYLSIYLSLHQLGTAPIKRKWKPQKRVGAPPNKKTTFQNISSKKTSLNHFSILKNLTRFCHVSNLVLYLAGSQATKKDGCNHSKLRIDGRIPKGPDAKSCI